MKGPKKPPPDTVGNVLGRIGQLKRTARRSASADVRGGADKDRALAKHMRAIEPALKKLQRRLDAARKSEAANPPPAAEDPVTKKRTRRKPAKKAAREPGDQEDAEDLLSALDSL